MGYARYDTEEQLKILNTLYERLNPYTNFFQPVMKLVEKRRNGSKVRKKHDRARTPYQSAGFCERVLESPCVSEERKKVLRDLYVQLNPVALKRELTKLQGRLVGKRARSLHPQKQLRCGHPVDVVYNATREVLR